MKQDKVRYESLDQVHQTTLESEIHLYTNAGNNFHMLHYVKRRRRPSLSTNNILRKDKNN